MATSYKPEVPPLANPKFEFPKIVGAEIAASNSGERVAGDFYDCIRVGPERVLFGLLDVAGRRETNQNILDVAQELLRTLGVELFSPDDINEAEAMVKLCLRLNHGVMEAASGVHPCPAFIGCYHEKFGTLCYTNAGHTPGLVRDDTGISELGSTGLPLGLFSHATCEAPTIVLEKGSALLLMSRGLVEGKSKDGDGDDSEFGVDRAKNFLRSDTSSTATALCAGFMNAVEEFVETPTVPDDVTAIAFVRTAQNS
jgi:phosphoserine phosphatase RsbU/P